MASIYLRVIHGFIIDPRLGEGEIEPELIYDLRDYDVVQYASSRDGFTTIYAGVTLDELGESSSATPIDKLNVTPTPEQMAEACQNRDSLIEALTTRKMKGPGWKAANEMLSRQNQAEIQKLIDRIKSASPVTVLMWAYS